MRWAPGKEMTAVLKCNSYICWHFCAKKSCVEALRRGQDSYRALTASVGKVSSGCFSCKKGFWNLWPEKSGVHFNATFVDGFVMSDQHLLQ